MADVLDSIPPELCVQCKAARSLCGISPCPLLARVRHHLPQKAPRSRDIFGSSPPSLFVGRHGYPNVTVGPMLPPEHLPDERARDLDSPSTWLDRYRIADVVGLRSSLLRTTHAVKVDRAARAPDRITRLSQELAVAARPVDAEVRLAKLPSWNLGHVSEFTAPHGPTVEVERAQLTENVRVENPIERATSDTDARAADVMAEMHRAGVDPYQMERILSAGLLGQARHRRLVPTRWSITATDDTLGKQLIERVRDLPTIDKPRVHTARHFGNRFQILLLPRIWSFENVEVWCGGSFWVGGRGAEPDAAGVAAPAVERVAASDFEDHTGRTAYASNTTGGYYATRIPILDHMIATGKQATAVALREITDEYTTPLGVWVVRETARRAMAAPPLEFEDMDSALRHMDRHSIHKLWRRDAPWLANLRRQRSLDQY